MGTNATFFKEKESCQVTQIEEDYDDFEQWAQINKTSRSLLIVSDPVVPSR